MKQGKLHHHKGLKLRPHVHGRKTTAAQVAGFVLVTLLALGAVDYMVLNSTPGLFQADQTLDHHGPDGV